MPNDDVSSPDYWRNREDGRQPVRTFSPEDDKPSFQTRVGRWCRDLFGPDIANNIDVRNYRFIEEALELVQALGCSKEDALKLVDYVYSRPAGEPVQEVGGTMVTLAALCDAAQIDMMTAGEIEQTRCETPEVRAKILRKQTSKLNPTAVLPGSAS